MSGNKSGMKGFLCICFCVGLLICSFSMGDYAAVATQMLVNQYNNFENSVNQSPKGAGSDGAKVIVEGYGGGDYANANVNVNASPQDIESLKKQAQELYKNYKKTGDTRRISHLYLILIAYLLPVEPKPPSPLTVSFSSSDKTYSTLRNGVITSCAIRSPLDTV